MGKQKAGIFHLLMKYHKDEICQLHINGRSQRSIAKDFCTSANIISRVLKACGVSTSDKKKKILLSDTERKRRAKHASRVNSDRKDKARSPRREDLRKPEVIIEACEMRGVGDSWTKIAARFNCHRLTIKRAIREFGETHNAKA